MEIMRCKHEYHMQGQKIVDFLLANLEIELIRKSSHLCNFAD